MKITFIFIVILNNFLSFIKNYKGNLTFFFVDDDELKSLEIGDITHNIKEGNIIDKDQKIYESNYIIEMYSGDIINANVISKNDNRFAIRSILFIGDQNFMINFKCDCEINQKDVTRIIKDFTFKYSNYNCKNSICTAISPYYCEDLNLTFYTDQESSSSISNITYYFNNKTDFYIIPEEIPSEVSIYCDNIILEKGKYYETSCDFTFKSSVPGKYTFSFNGVNIENDTNIQSNYPCNTTLITCFKGCKECLGKKDITLTTQNCSSCNDGYIFFENETNLGCCFPDKTEIDGYYIDYKELKYKKCHSYCLKCKYNSTYCLKCKKGFPYFNFQCFSHCPNKTHINEEGNLCLCNNKFYIDDNNITKCLNKDENCIDQIPYIFLLNKNGECLKECNNEYPYSFNKICYNKCPNNSIAIEDNKICECKYKYYEEKNKLFCMNENEECNGKYPYLINNKCVKSCNELKLYIFNNQCLSSCEGNKKKSEDNKYCICRYNYYIKNLFNYCLNENEKCPEEYLNLYNNKCVNKCPEDYLSFNYKCIKNCPENYYEFNSTCVKTCPKNYYKTIKKCENVDCLERDLNENILLIHENNYEEFIGKNTCDVNNKNYNYFIAEIYDSNVILNNSNNKTNIDLSECENILKKNYNIPENKSLTIFKIDYYFENTSIPKIEYKIFNNDQLLNLSYCENISLSISRPVNLEKLNIDISKFNETLDFPEIDIFDINSNFFNDICSMFTTSNKTDVPLNDRKNDYFQNVSLCDEGCIYDSFDKKTYKVNCICGNIQSIETKTKNNINNLFSNSNLKVLKCYSLYLKTKNYFKNFGSFIFKIAEFFEIILVFSTLINGFSLILHSIKINKNNTYINNPPKKNNFYSFSSNNEKYKSNIKNIIIYKDINVLEDNINNSKNIFIKKKGKKIFIKNKIYTNEEINILNYENSLLIDNRNFLNIYYSFLEYSQLIIFTFITKTDFNLKQIKISLFIFSFILFLTFNTLFFTDESMSHIYKQGGTFDFIYNLPKTIFSGVCCGVINFLLKFLSLSQKDIDKLNKINNEKDKIKEINKYRKIWYCKIIIFYILIFLFIELFQIYVGTFCTIYKNTQKHLIKSTLISFILSMIYPFGICLLTAIFRKISLMKKNKFLFLISKLFQMF